MKNLNVLILSAFMFTGCASVNIDGYTPIQWYKNTDANAEFKKIFGGGAPDKTVGFKYFDGSVNRLYAPDGMITGQAISPVIYVKWHKTQDPISRAVVNGSFCDVYAPDPPLLPSRPGSKGRGTYYADQWILLGMAIKKCFNEEAKSGYDWDTIGHEYKHVVDGLFHD